MLMFHIVFLHHHDATRTLLLLQSEPSNDTQTFILYRQRFSVNPAAGMNRILEQNQNLEDSYRTRRAGPGQ